MLKKSDPKFNWTTPVLLTLAGCVGLFLMVPSAMNSASQVAAALIGNLCLGAIFPGLLVWTLAIIFQTRGRPAPAWWGPWPRRVSVLVAVVLLGAVVLKLLTNAPGDDAYRSGLARLEAGSYSLAESDFNHLMISYPNNPHVGEVQSRLPDLYSGWASQLTQNGSYLFALEKITFLRALGPDNTQAADALYQAAVAGLSHDTGKDGQTYLKALTGSLCSAAGGPGVIDSGVALADIKLPPAPGEPARAMLCKDPNVSFDLPADMLAETPAQLKYVIVLASSWTKRGSCSYSLTGDLMSGVQGVVQLFQANWAGKIIRVETGETISPQVFEGSITGCPDTYEFQSGGGVTEAALYGGSPNQPAVTRWVAEVLR